MTGKGISMTTMFLFGFWVGIALLITLLRGLASIGTALWPHLGLAGSWTLREIVDPATCYLCIVLGVHSTTFVPASMLPLLNLGENLTAALSVPVTFIIAGVIFDRQAYARWRASGRIPLLARMLRAFSDGVLWPLRWR